MKERPILFNGEMVRAILDGRKTQTRRVMKVQPVNDGQKILTCMSTTGNRKDIGKIHWVNVSDDLRTKNEGKYFSLPYGVGDWLWVRETWSPILFNEDGVFIRYKDNQEKYFDIPNYTSDDDKYWKWHAREWQKHSDFFEAEGVKYEKTDCYDVTWIKPESGWPVKWKPSIFMPKWASRITREIIAVRYERLQDISEEDAFAEGISGGDWRGDPVGEFRKLWDSINKKRGYGWDKNPWVWVVTF